MTLLRDSPDDLFALCGASAESLGIPDPGFVEKDYWVVELLRSVTAPLALEPVGSTPCSAQIMFKGGTSLSKAYKLISRFSEDVDILVHIEGYGTQARDGRVLKPLCERARVDLGLSADQAQRVSSETGKHRDIDYLYPRRIESAALRPGVRLEMGTRGGTMPGVQVRQVRSFIAEHLARTGATETFDELAPVEVHVIAPVRTLAEKLALLHRAGCDAVRGNAKRLGEAGRHFYDVHCLLLDQTVRDSLAVPGTIHTLIADVHQHGIEFDPEPEPRPEHGYATSPAFQAKGRTREVAEASYRLAMGLVWGARPSFDDCLATIKDAAALI